MGSRKRKGPPLSKRPTNFKPKGAEANQPKHHTNNNKRPRYEQKMHKQGPGNHKAQPTPQNHGPARHKAGGPARQQPPQGKNFKPPTPQYGISLGGRVNLAKTPARLVEVAKRNSTASPLLRLPGEIRALIWQYALGGHIIIPFRWVPLTWEYKGKAVVRVGAQTRTDRFTAVPSAFRLPEVCRQIYAETASLTYSANTFHFNYLSGPVTKWEEPLPTRFERWSRTLIAAHRGAITDIELSGGMLLELLVHTDKRGWLRGLFPGLRRVHGTASVGWVVWNSTKLAEAQIPEDLESWLRMQVKSREGEDVEFVFPEEFWDGEE